MDSADRIARLQAVTAAFSESLTPAQVAEVVTRQGVAALGARRIGGAGEAILGAAKAFAGGSLRDDVCLLLARRKDIEL